jgi:3-oxoadipate enol-lactonase
MPFVENQGASIHSDEQGHGSPLLLIMGLGYASDMWHRTRPVLSVNYRTIALDAPGHTGIPRRAVRPNREEENVSC